MNEDVMPGFHSVTHRSAIAILFLLAVAATPAQAQARFTVSADGQEVMDTRTNLLWRRCAEGMLWDGKACSGKPAKFNFAGAKKQAASAAKIAGKDWRVPTKDELRGIVVKSKTKPMTDIAAFPNTPSAMFWATRPGFNDNLNAWLVHFGNGRVYGNSNEGRFHLRLVRNSP
jgi:hypothetical protein